MITSYKTIRLGDYCEFINGGSWSDKEYVDNGVSVVKVTNMKGGTVDFNDLSCLPVSSLKKYNKNLLKKGDLVIATVGSHPNQPNSVVGRTITIPEKAEGFLLNQNAVCIRISNPDILDDLFLKYLTKTKYFSYLAYSRARGSANQVRLSITELSNFKLIIPNLPAQKKIASILSAYDDLIENNKQRIKLLEEMAEEIYKEWFVRFRFPGYQNTNFVDKEGKLVPHGTKGAIPEGWEKKPVDEFESFSKSASKLRKFQGEKRYLATADVTEIKITGDGEVIDWDNKPSRAQLKPEINSVFFARMSNTYKVLNFSEANKNLIEELALSSGFLGLKAKNKLCFPYLFTFIKGETFHKYKDLYANGATQVSLTNEGLHMIRLYEPKLDLIEKFGEIVYSFYDEINTLINKNQILQETRDLLLPRLISGKLSVEDLEVERFNVAAEPQEKYSK